jgi:hypothetical protein
MLDIILWNHIIIYIIITHALHYLTLSWF